MHGHRHGHGRGHGHGHGHDVGVGVGMGMGMGMGRCMHSMVTHDYRRLSAASSSDAVDYQCLESAGNAVVLTTSQLHQYQLRN